MEERILKILQRHCEEILDYDGEDMVGDGIIDSFTVFSIVNDLEDEFDILIPAKCVIPEMFKNLEGINALVKELLEDKN